MAFTPASSLNHSSNINIRDSQTAARLFVDDQFRLAPKFKFLFHVAFGINPSTLMDASLLQRHSNEINMLVKTCDLPSFELKTETLNQYNRKKVIQTTHNYNAINIKFHDDNMGVINQLWQNYYNYYYADPSSAKDPGAYARTAMKNFSYMFDTYGLNNGSTVPFFNYIKIYQMARHEYVSYTLHNPVITKWNHQNVSYFETTTHENTMEVQYEAVSYDAGNVGDGEPIGFAETHYDLTPSPLSGTISPNASPSFVSNVSLSSFDNANTTVNTYQNTQTPLPTGTISGIIQSATSASAQSVSGLQGIVFPNNQPSDTLTVANPVNLNI